MREHPHPAGDGHGDGAAAALATFPNSGSDSRSWGPCQVARRLLGALLCSSIVAALGGCDAPAPQAAAVPLQARLASLQGGGSASLADWSGKIVVLNVWASWCEPCRSEMASLERLHRRLDPKQAVVLGLSVDADRNLAREYLLRNAITFANFSDGDAQLSRTALGVNGLPQTLILDRDGRVRERIVGARDWADARLALRLGLPLKGAAAASVAAH
ncbi:MAG: TlpA disulfide reductase family protein [Burkholderiaceae bacterium]